jgi:butyrate kinase
VDELEPIARISGMPEIERVSLSHALSLKAAARRAAQEIGKSYQELNLIVVHLEEGYR